MVRSLTPRSWSVVAEDAEAKLARTTRPSRSEDPLSAWVADTVLWDRVTVGDRVRLTQCIVADDVVIPAGMQYDRMVITRDSIMPL